MARRKRHDEHDNHEAWAIPYGDLVTLLLAFFVVMYAMSSVNEGKYRVLSDSLTEAFHGAPRAPQPVQVGTPEAPVEQLPLTQVNRMIRSTLPAYRLKAAPRLQDGSTGGSSTAATQGPPVAVPSALTGAADSSNGERSELDQVADEVAVAMQKLIASGEVHVRRYDNRVEVDISTDILFASGVAQLSSGAVPVLQSLADSLKAWPNRIRVEGHTDNRPISTRAFPSNWELSAARAASVVHLFSDRGITPERLSVIGFGEYQPSMTNVTAAGRNANRRVEVTILAADGSPPGLGTVSAPSSK
jgi:chemotaxis protein MotB